jgi:hypothetical protein
MNISLTQGVDPYEQEYDYENITPGHVRYAAREARLRHATAQLEVTPLLFPQCYFFHVLLGYMA